ncbi:MAG: hypothetical protein ACLTDS_03090 [Bianqueaceae bacterium]
MEMPRLVRGHLACRRGGRKVEAGVHKETKSLSAEGRWAKRSDSWKMHAGMGKKGEGWRAKGDKISAD